jgi:hypothetical protein
MLSKPRAHHSLQWTRCYEETESEVQEANTCVIEADTEWSWGLHRNRRHLKS